MAIGDRGLIGKDTASFLRWAKSAIPAYSLTARNADDLSADLVLHHGATCHDAAPPQEAVAARALRNASRKMRLAARRLVAAFFLALSALFLVTGVAQSQVATINDGSFATNTALNSSSTASGVLGNLGNGGGPGGWKTAQFDFGYSVTGGAVWSGGVQFQSQGGVEQIWVQPIDTDFDTATGTYTMDFTRGVAGLTFYHGGLDNDDTVRVQAFYQGNPVNLPTSYFGSFTGNVSIIASTATSVTFRSPLNGNANERANEFQVIFPANVLVDSLVFTTAKQPPAGDPANANTITLAFYLFDWLPLTIDAQDDDLGTVSSTTGGIGIGNVLEDNGNGPDTLDDPNTPATDVATATTVAVTPVGSPPAGITLNADGSVDVAAGTPAATYLIPYQICEIANPTNCATATATVIVGAGPIDAVDDTPVAVSGVDGATIPTVLGNDTLDGDPVDPADITLTPGTAPTPASGSITMNPDGTITVAPGTTAGTYTYEYEICEVLNPTNCDTATATVIVDEAPIDAVDDAPAPVSGVDGATIPTVLGNDTLDGDPVDPADITLTPGTAPTPASGSITMNPDGTITVAPGTTAGTYTYEYEICEILNPTNCDTATATVVVDASEIIADNDDFSATPVNGLTGGTAGNVFGNDFLDGEVIDPALTTISVTADGGLTGVTISDAGDVTVPAGTPAGTYTLTYELCEELNPTNCDTADVIVVVEPPVIDAVNDNFIPTPVIGSVGGPAGNVLTNDTLNGAPVVPAAITISVTNPGGLTGVTISPAGVLSVPPGTPAATYQVTYEICEVANPTNCDTANASVDVIAAPINAVNNSFPQISGLSGGNTASVLGNDTLNGLPVVPSEITLTPGTAPTPASGSITMNPDGTITVARGRRREATAIPTRSARF
ncbi:MAG: hypothetical protein HC844_07475 [Tabrizicola sp.]|nr:hypothetical protein [Tabrizicola sp.]